MIAPHPPALRPGSTPRNRPANLFAATLLALTAIPVSSSAAVDAVHSANWFDPARSGEGWSLEIIAPDTALGYWFTYDETGEQRWLVGVGRIEGDRIEFPNLLVTSGGRFGPAFDPDHVVRTEVGTVTMQFSDCTNGSQEVSAFGQTLTLPLARLTTTLTLDCPRQSLDFADGRAGRSGSWFDPARSGEGFSLQVMADGRAVVTWYTYDLSGRQQWMIGIGEQVGSQLVFPELLATRGARFGRDFDPDQVERFVWGELRLHLGCRTGRAHYRSLLPEFGEGEISLTRLSSLEQLPCTGPDAPTTDFEQADWSVAAAIGPGLSELPAAQVGEWIYVGGGLTSLSSNSRAFWRYRPASDEWQRLPDLPGPRDHAMMAAHDGRLYFFGGNLLPLRNASNTAWRYDPETGIWTVLAAMPETRSAGGAASLGEHIYVAGGDRASVVRYTPASNQWTRFPITDPWPRDHASVVAHRGEIWLLGGRDPGSDAHPAVAIFNPDTGLDRPGPAMATGRSGFTAASDGETLIVAGGESLPARMISSVEAMRAEADGWRELAPLPIPVHGAGGAFLGERLYLLLGSIQAGGITNPGRVQVLSTTP